MLDNLMLLILCCCVVVGVDKLRERERERLIRFIRFILVAVNKKQKAMRRNYIVLNEKHIFTSLAISSLTSGTKL